MPFDAIAEWDVEIAHAHRRHLASYLECLARKDDADIKEGLEHLYRRLTGVTDGMNFDILWELFQIVMYYKRLNESCMKEE